MLKKTDRVRTEVIEDVVCDECEKVLGERFNKEIPIEVDTTHYSDKTLSAEGQEHQFCSYECFVKYLPKINLFEGQDLYIWINTENAKRLFNELSHTTF